jgi:hypothetical protein
LLALSVGDLIAGGLTGEPRTLRRLLLGTVGTGVASWVVLSQTGLAPRGATSVLVGVELGTCCWLLCKLQLARAERRQEGTLARRWATFALLVSGSSVAVPLVFAAPLHSDLPRVSAWTRALPFPRARAVTGAEFLLLLAILLFLTGPANSLVRTLLTAARTEWKTSEQKLRGGRYIGVIERWMIFTLALAGEPTAAALIVSAKSLLRFPELSKAVDRKQSESPEGSAITEIDAVTEYLLLGSLASWALALVFVLLLIQPESRRARPLWPSISCRGTTPRARPRERPPSCWQRARMEAWAGGCDR